MSPDVLTIAEVPDGLLDGIRRSGPPGVFYHRGLLEMWELVFGWQGVVVRAGDATMIGFVKTSPLGRMFYSLPFGWHGGFVGGRAGAPEAEAVFGWLKSQGFVQETIVQYDEIPGHAFPARYHRREFTTHLLRLEPAQPYATNTARNLKKARAFGLSIRSLAAGQRESFVQLLREHVRRTHEARILPEPFYLELFALGLRAGSGVEVCGAFRGDEFVACHVYFATESEVFYFDGFSSQAGLDTCANFLLFDAAIRGSRERGAQGFNFGATPAGDEGLERFKSGWGAVGVTCREYERRSPVKRAADLVRGR